MSKITKITFIIIVFALVGYAASFFVQPPSNATESELSTFRWALANSILYTSFHVGAAILFVIGVSAYRAKLRVAYMAIAIGIILVGVGLAHVVLLRIFGLLDSPWVQYGGVMIPFVAAGISIYLGTRLRTKLVSISSPLTNPAFVVLLLVVCIILVSLLPHGHSLLPEVFFDITNAINVLGVVVYAVSVGLVAQIKNRGGAHYASSMVWLMAGLLGTVIISLSILAGALITGEIPTGYLQDVLIIMGGLLYLKAGHSFAKTKEL